MRALRYDSFGPIAQVARFVDILRPEPAPGEVLVLVTCARCCNGSARDAYGR